MKGLLLALAMLAPFAVVADDELTVLELQARVQELIAQISAIELELRVAEEHRAPAAACPLLTRTLQTGSTGNDVRALQVFLMRTADFMHSDTTAYFGEKTAAAVRSFQCRELGICAATEPGSGVVGPRTRAAIKAACESGFSYNAQSPVTEASGVFAYRPVCAQPPVPACPEGQSCVAVLPAARTYADDAARVADGATVLHEGACTCGDNGIACHATQAASCDFWGQKIVHGSTVAAFRKGSVSTIALCESEARTCDNGTLTGSFGFATCAVR